ncbi:helix-turn-helix domain-containing protein [Mycobacterium sp. IS-3022]|uniref:PucR family transcriptional regulator n=1 Tax=Mycobacterium sp. IS-3022 TaxID=1772277 RepID=UPI000741586B|nr:helix-turn-helix domain-containing protein [Mycobacterium sp. IS-3022]KUI05871.1 PucR family transcriptional regulator [Mycobacterium sp. IS-3022]
MTERDVDATAVAESAATVVARLNDRLGEVTQTVQQYLIAEISELRDEGQLLELLYDSTEQNIDTVFSAIRHNIPIENVEPPTAALEYARRLAQRGKSANPLVRAYRLGQQTVLNIVLDDIRHSDLDPRRGLDVFEQITATTFKYIDWISQQVIAAYQSERDRWLENQNSTRALRVRELLDADALDVDAMSTAIGYPLRRLHLAVVVWCTEADHGDELVQMERFVRALGDSLGSQGRPMFIAADRVTGWGWIPLTAKAAQQAVAHTREFAESHDRAPSVAIGDPLPGLDGFRRSHDQALGAHAVAIAAGAHAKRIVANNDSGLSAAALVGQNIDATRAWVGEVLGPLASATENDERLRETLRVFLQTGSSYKAAAGELNLHFNSVKYRVQRAEQRRGRPIAEDRLDVELALLLCHWLQAAVLH